MCLLRPTGNTYCPIKEKSSTGRQRSRRICDSSTVGTLLRDSGFPRFRRGSGGLTRTDPTLVALQRRLAQGLATTEFAAPVFGIKAKLCSGTRHTRRQFAAPVFGIKAKRGRL